MFVFLQPSGTFSNIIISDTPTVLENACINIQCDILCLKTIPIVFTSEDYCDVVTLYPMHKVSLMYGIVCFVYLRWENVM